MPIYALTYRHNREKGWKMICPKCGSENVKVEMVTETNTKRRGCIGWFFWILLVICTFGLLILIPLLTNSKTKTKTYKMAVCQNCGHSWRIYWQKLVIYSKSQFELSINGNHAIEESTVRCSTSCRIIGWLDLRTDQVCVKFQYRSWFDGCNDWKIFDWVSRGW